MDLDTRTLQRMLDCGASRVGTSLDDWEAAQRAGVPEPPLIRPFARRHWRAALEAARGLGEPTSEVPVDVIPVWWGDNDIDAPVRDWRPTVALLASALEHSRFAPDECVDGPVAVRARALLRVWVVGALARTRDVAPEPPVAIHGPYAAVRRPGVEVASVADVRRVELRGPPDADVPPYSLQVAPAVPLDEATRTRLAALVADYDGALWTA